MNGTGEAGSQAFVPALLAQASFAGKRREFGSPCQAGTRSETCDTVHRTIGGQNGETRRRTDRNSACRFSRANPAADGIRDNCAAHSDHGDGRRTWRQ